MQRIVLGFIAFCATLGAAIGIFLFVSAVPYIGIIGKFVAGLLIMGVLCAAWLLVVKTYSWTGIMHSQRIRARNHERLIEAGGDVSFYLQPIAPNYTIFHASKEHNMGLIAPPPTVKVSEVPNNTDTIAELRKHGQSMHAIAEALKIPYNQVRKICNELEGGNATV